jgi:ATP-dependent Lon protease
VERIEPDVLITTNCMNPIIFMDELDKVSNTSDGIDVQNLLIHLTDPVQNMEFHDKYFAGINIDLSKAVFVFSFNDINLVHPVLKDRLHIVKVPDPSVDDKVVIGKRYLLPEMCKNVGVKLEDININDDIIRSIINSYCKEEKGVRDLKRCIETILLRLNLARYVGKCKYSKIDKIVFPFTVDLKTVEILLKKRNSQADWPEHVKNMYM